MVIEELQLRKDKNKSPSSVVDNHGSSMPNNDNSNETLVITLNQKRQLPDPLIYVEVNADAGQTSPSNIVAMGLDEVDYEDNVSEDGSLVRKTKYTIGRRNIMNRDIIDDTKMHRGPSRIDRWTLTKSTQLAISRSKPRGAVLKTPKSHKDPIQPVGRRLFGRGNQKMAEIEHVPAARSVFCMPTATRRDVKGGNSWGVALG